MESAVKHSGAIGCQARPPPRGPKWEEITQCTNVQLSVTEANGACHDQDVCWRLDDPPCANAKLKMASFPHVQTRPCCPVFGHRGVGHRRHGAVFSYGNAGIAAKSSRWTRNGLNANIGKMVDGDPFKSTANRGRQHFFSSGCVNI